MSSSPRNADAAKTSQPAKISVLIVDDHAVVRAGLTALLGTAPDIELVGEASDGETAVRLADLLRPDVIVMDVTMGSMDGVTATRNIRAKGLTSKILVLTMHDEKEFLMSMLEAGASGYLVKNAAQNELVLAIRAVARDEMIFRSRAGAVFAKSLGKGPRPESGA